MPIASKSAMKMAYDVLLKRAKRDMKGAEVDSALKTVITIALEFLESCEPVQLNSQVRGKQYFAFREAGETKLTRPINKDLFDIARTVANLDKLVAADVKSLSPESRAAILYTGSISYCCHTDLTRTGDQRTPGTFFEAFIAHMVAKTFNMNPTSSIAALNLDLKADLPTDYIFALDNGKSRIHLPVKTSTRERAIQPWAHQRILDGIYGVGRFKGILVCLAETNMQTRTNSVLEVCLPDQWSLYQMFIAQLHRVYYMDPPEIYLPLAKKYPFIQVKHFAEFFDEAEMLANASPLA